MLRAKFLCAAVCTAHFREWQITLIMIMTPSCSQRKTEPSLPLLLGAVVLKCWEASFIVITNARNNIYFSNELDELHLL